MIDTYFPFEKGEKERFTPISFSIFTREDLESIVERTKKSRGERGRSLAIAYLVTTLRLPTRMKQRHEPCTRFRVVPLHNAVSLNRLWSPRYTHSAVGNIRLPPSSPSIFHVRISPQVRSRKETIASTYCSPSCHPLSLHPSVHFFFFLQIYLPFLYIYKNYYIIGFMYPDLSRRFLNVQML